MYYKIEIKNTIIALGFQWTKQEKAKLFLFKYYYEKQASRVGTLNITRNLTIGLRYENQRIKMITHKHQTIKERIA